MRMSSASAKIKDTMEQSRMQSKIISRPDHVRQSRRDRFQVGWIGRQIEREG